jgi:hypothetical protein
MAAYDEDWAREQIESFLEGEDGNWMFVSMDETTRIGQQTAGWEFWAKDLIPGAHGEGSDSHGYLHPGDSCEWD